MVQPLDIDEVCSKIVDYEKLLLITEKKGWSDKTPYIDEGIIFSRYPINTWEGTKNPKDYWKNRWELEGKEWMYGSQNVQIKEWLIDQARIRHIKKNWYTINQNSEE